MTKLSSLVLTLSLLFALVGCGGSSSLELPEEVITEDTVAVQWVDFSAMEPDDGAELLYGIANGMPDEQAKARMWLSAEGDQIDVIYRERWEAFTKAGATGMLVVYYCYEKDDKTVNERHTFIKAKPGTDGDKIEEALEEFQKDDIRRYDEDKDAMVLEEVGDKGWFWVTKKDDKNLPKMPDDGDEDTLKAFKDLIKQADGAPMLVAWKKNDVLAEEISDALEKEEKKTSPDPDKVKSLEHADQIDSVVMAVMPGGSPWQKSVLGFDKEDNAKDFAKDFEKEQRKDWISVKRAMIRSEDPAHPSDVDRMVDKVKPNVSGKTVTLKADSSAVEGGLKLAYVSNTTVFHGTRGVMQFRLDDKMLVPNNGNMPAVWDSFTLDFGDSLYPRKR